MISRLTLERSHRGASGHWAPGPASARPLPSTPRAVRAERELAEWLGRRAVFGATPADVGAVLLGQGVPCEAWTATVAEMSERQLAALVDEAARMEAAVPPAAAPQPSSDTDQQHSEDPPSNAHTQPAALPIVPITTSDVTVTFGPGSLGLALGENPAWVASSSSVGDSSCFSAMVDRLNKDADGGPGPAERTGVIRTTDLLSAIDGRSVATVPYAEIIGMVKVAPRPLMLSFRRAPTAATATSNTHPPANQVASPQEGVPPLAQPEPEPEPELEPEPEMQPESNTSPADAAPVQPVTEPAVAEAPTPPASLPQDIVHTVTQTASWVAKHGGAFEQTIRRRNEGNPSFGFLFDEQSEAAAFYRACVAWEARGPESEASPAVAVVLGKAAVVPADEMSQAEQDLFKRINAAHADISDRIGQASADIESMQPAAEVDSPGGGGGKQIEAWAVLQELKLQEDVLQAIRTKAKTTGGQLDAGSSAMMEMTFSRVVRLTEQLADLELGQEASPQTVAVQDRSRRPKSAPPRNANRAMGESQSARGTPAGYAQPRSGSRGRQTGRNAHSRPRKRSGTPERMRYAERRPPRNANRGVRGAASGRTRSKSVGHRRPAAQRGSGYYNAERSRSQRSRSARGPGSQRGSSRSKSRGGRRAATNQWSVETAAERLNDTLWAEYSEAAPFGASAERFWPEVFPSSRHRSEAYHRGGTEETPGPGSYAEHQPMGQRASSVSWRVGNDDLYAFLKAAAAEDQLPAFWREQFFRVRDLVDPELGVLIDEHDLATELGVTNSAARRKILRQAKAVLQSSLAMKRQIMARDHGPTARFGGHGSHLGGASMDARRGRDAPGPGTYSPRDSSFQVPKRTNALYFTTTGARGGGGGSPRRARSPSPAMAKGRRTPQRPGSSASSASSSRRRATSASRRGLSLEPYDDY
jgi:hypothetical protein